MPMAKKGNRTLDPGDNPEPRVPDQDKPVSASNPPESRGNRLPSDVTPLAVDGQTIEGEPADPNVPDVTKTTNINSPRPVPPEQQAVSQPTAKAKSPATTPTKTSGGQTTPGAKAGTKTS